MGECCSTPRSFSYILSDELKNIKVSQLRHSFIKSLFYPSITSLNGYNLDQLSPGALAVYKNSLKTISDENFLKISKEHFIDPENKFQLSLFKHIYEMSYQRRSFLYFTIVLLCGSSIEEKLNEFVYTIFTLEDKETLKYLNVKEIIYQYMKCAMVSPLYALRDTMQDKIAIANINSILFEQCNDTNIQHFLNYLCENFESMKMSEENEDVFDSIFICSPNNIPEIFQVSKEYFFHPITLREAFNKKFSFEFY